MEHTCGRRHISDFLRDRENCYLSAFVHPNRSSRQMVHRVSDLTTWSEYNHLDGGSLVDG